jgi:hypothetical protein
VGFQRPHMEDVVDAGAFWELEAVSNAPNALQHLERASVARPQLALGSGVKGLRYPVKQA